MACVRDTPQQTHTRKMGGENPLRGQNVVEISSGLTVALGHQRPLERLTQRWFARNVQLHTRDDAPPPEKKKTLETNKGAPEHVRDLEARRREVEYLDGVVVVEQVQEGVGAPLRGQLPSLQEDLPGALLAVGDLDCRALGVELEGEICCDLVSYSSMYIDVRGG